MTTIDKNVPVPPTKRTSKRARKPKAGEPNGAAEFIKALKFVSLCQRESGTAFQVHCLMQNNWCVGYDGVITMGCKIEESITAYPKTLDLLEALQRCGEAVSITQLPNCSIAVKSGKFRAAIDCITADSLPLSYPDPQIAVIDDRIKAGFEAIGWLATEGAEKAYMASVLLQANTMVSTNRSVLLEYWHGIDLPPDLLIPKASIVALSKIDKKLVGFGYTPRFSVTFWYEDGSFLKTQLFEGSYPDYQAIFSRDTNQYMQLPEDFFTAFKSVSKFTKTGFVYLRGDRILSHQTEELGACYEVNGIPDGICFNVEYLGKLEPFFKSICVPDFSIAYFVQGNVRGALAGGNKP